MTLAMNWPTAVDTSPPEDCRGPLVTVVVPSYNVAPWVTECLRSVLRETRIDLEVILVDDHSTDATVALASEISAVDDRLIIVTSPGSGGGQARNIGARMARGQYIMFCDADDIVAPGGILRLLQAAIVSDADMVVGNFLKFSANRTWSPTERWALFTQRREGITVRDVPDLIRNRACWNRLFARRFWEEEAIRFPTVPRSNDIVPMTIAITRARRIAIVPETVYLYRQRPGNGSMTAQATSSVGTVSYLGQEAICRALISAMGDETVSAVYWAMVLDSDTWVQARRYVSHVANGGERSLEVEAYIGELVGERRARSWQRVRPERQALYALIAVGDTDAAVQLEELFSIDTAPVRSEAIVQRVQLLSKIADSGYCTSEALFALYTSMVLRAIGRSPFAAGERLTVVDSVRSLGASMDLSSSEAISNLEMAELHKALTESSDKDAIATLTRRDTADLRVAKVCQSHGRVFVDLREIPDGAELVRAVARTDSSVEVPVACETGESGARIVLESRKLRTEGAWEVVAFVEFSGVEVELPVMMDSSVGNVSTPKISRFAIRRPSTKSRFIAVRRGPTYVRVLRASRRLFLGTRGRGK